MEPDKGFKILLIGEGGNVNSQKQYTLIPMPKVSALEPKTNKNLSSDQIIDQIVSSYASNTNKGKK